MKPPFRKIITFLLFFLAGINISYSQEGAGNNHVIYNAYVEGKMAPWKEKLKDLKRHI
ncbi:MAG: hypothetical protein R2744_04145 [Bacteroidales bacterium]